MHNHNIGIIATFNIAVFLDLLHAGHLTTIARALSLTTFFF
jgi:hypothetical protein